MDEAIKFVNNRAPMTSTSVVAMYWYFLTGNHYDYGQCWREYWIYFCVASLINVNHCSCVRISAWWYDDVCGRSL